MKDEVIGIISNLDCEKDCRSLSIIYYFLKGLLEK